MNFIKSALAAAALATVIAPASAAVTLAFEDIPNGTPVGSFYLGYVFNPATLALVDADAGGTGNFTNEPSPNTIMFFLDRNEAILDVTVGFDTGFSFFYTSSTAAPVTVWSGLNGDASDGTLLATINLSAQFNNNCLGDPNGQFCHWDAIGVSRSLAPRNQSTSAARRTRRATTTSRSAR